MSSSSGKKPQQNELRRSNLGAASQDGVELNASSSGLPAVGEDKHPVPEGNRPGWEQDGTDADPDKPIDKFLARQQD